MAYSLQAENDVEGGQSKKVRVSFQSGVSQSPDPNEFQKP